MPPELTEHQHGEITLFGLWKFLRMSFGLWNAARLLMENRVQDLSFVFVYIDDILIAMCPTGKYNGTGDAFINNRPNCEAECHCKSLPCLYSNGRCRDGCVTGWSGRSCYRREGDIDECEGTRGMDYDQDCHECVNTIGRYTCRCDQHYELDSETNRQCIVL
ncbi:hypothetical protein CAPTEDRAFT_209951 [Capitella teleta]|uniref:EGF-like calcium-binding domain-containing protein n=1 Tax=Capitella teleta TaxID=283909 RepID=R7U8Y7_CAPTE|nr:hypothetical protein CAPTEDRAFT_209951 [Capitella teleta]|eukprot:ELU02601.1 hypothetical protein CAPTEDRAFT_209951 [Capitella teleta]